MIEHDQVSRPRRFDERGIALQTIIIIVVLMAIAGAIAVVLFGRASEETERLEQVETVYDRIDSTSACVIAGGRPSSEDSGDTTKIKEPDPDNSEPFKLCYPPG